MLQSLANLLLFVAFLICCCQPGRGDDYLLTIGGGPQASSNQVSLENNVRYLQRVLPLFNLKNLHQTILFSDGGHEYRDLQFDAQRDREDLRVLLAQILGPADGISYDYRSSSIPEVSGSAEPDVIDQTLKSLATELNERDRLLIYFTGHGGRGRQTGGPSGRGRRGGAVSNSSSEASRSNESSSERDADGTSETESERRNTGGRSLRPGRNDPALGNFLHLWKNKELTVVDWTKKLDKLPPHVPVVAVMVQCYSGGFGNFIFEGGNPVNGLSEQPRCGFFSTVPDRVAAGCTPNVNEAEYREYSSYFFEALSGESRTGEKISPPDFDGDGQTSFLEAHAYSVIKSETIDIPVRTTDIFLRQVVSPRISTEHFTANSDIEELLNHANPCELAVILSLSEEFSLNGSDRFQDAEKLIRQLRAEKKKIDDELSRERTVLSSIRKEIGTKLKQNWPEMVNPWHPRVSEILATDSNSVLELIQNSDRYQVMISSLEEIDQMQEESSALENQIVKLERLKYWLETLVLEANLSRDGDEKLLAGLKKIVDLENTCLNQAP